MQVLEVHIFFLQEDLTEPEVVEMNAQFEVDRIMALSIEDKLAEKNMRLDSVLGQSATMVSFHHWPPHVAAMRFELLGRYP